MVVVIIGKRERVKVVVKILEVGKSDGESSQRWGSKKINQVFRQTQNIWQRLAGRRSNEHPSVYPTPTTPNTINCLAGRVHIGDDFQTELVTADYLLLVICLMPHALNIMERRN